MNHGRHAGDARFATDPSRARRRLLDGRHRSDQRSSSRRSCSATGYVTVAERTPRAAGFSRRAAGESRRRLASCSRRRPCRCRWTIISSGGRTCTAPNWRHPSGTDEQHRRQGQRPVVHVAYEDAEAYAQLGGQTPADRSRMGVRRARRTVRPAYSVGRRIPAGRQVDGEHVPGTFPRSRHRRRRRFRRHRAGGRSFRRMATASTTWRAMSGSGSATGTGRTTMRTARGGGTSRAIRKAPSRRSTRPSRREQARDRGGSFLCTDQYCSRYMVGTRGKGEVSTGTNHLGFRCVKDVRSLTPA